MSTESGKGRVDARWTDGILAREISTTTKELVEDALAYCEGNQTRASELLGCSTVYLWKLLKRAGINLAEIKAQSLAGEWIYRTAPDGAPWVSLEW